MASGCLGSPLGMGVIAAVVNRYNDVAYDGRTGDMRSAAYDECVTRDNSSWSVIDACMEKKGYTLKK
jgi:hypothetical protein